MAQDSSLCSGRITTQANGGGGLPGFAAHRFGAGWNRVCRIEVAATSGPVDRNNVIDRLHLVEASVPARLTRGGSGQHAPGEIGQILQGFVGCRPVRRLVRLLLT
jgi:hypothetical protein